jgi:microcystin-dependent protein
MASNSILQFAHSELALVQSQAAYAADTERPLGNQPGVARPDFVNKAIKQLATISAGLAQYLADNQGTNVVDTLTPAQIAAMLIDAIKNTTAMPAGTIVWMAGTTAPVGTVKLNGAMLSRATYARLWAFAQGSGNITANDAEWFANAFGRFSPGDGATNFRVPDLRGLSLRAVDDGRGIEPGRGIGTYEGDQNQSHDHGANDPGHGHAYGDPGHFHFQETQYVNESGSGTPWGSGGGAFEGTYGWPTGTSGTNITITPSATGITIAAQGGTEVRVKNIALLPIMFF